MEEKMIATTTNKINWDNIVCEDNGLVSSLDEISHRLSDIVEIPHLKKYVKKDDLSRLMWKRGGRIFVCYIKNWHSIINFQKGRNLDNYRTFVES